jgi:hypothetical protein
MDTWIKQEGYPVVEIKDTNQQQRSGAVTKVASQNRFFRDMNPSDKRYSDQAKGCVRSTSFWVGDYDLNEHHDWLKEQKQ